MKIADVVLGLSDMTNTIYAYVPDKKGLAKTKKDVSASAFFCVMKALRNGGEFMLDNPEDSSTYFTLEIVKKVKKVKNAPKEETVDGTHLHNN